MKKLLCLALALIMLFSCVVTLAEEDLPEINFRGYEFGSTLAEIKKTLEAEGVHGDYASGRKSVISEGRDIIDKLTGSENYYGNDADKKLFINYNAYRQGTEWKEIEVAGYVTTYWLLFIRPEQSGQLVEKDDEAIFYAGCYIILHDSKEKDSIFFDLINKLSGLYGEAKVEEYSASWQGDGDTMIVLSAEAYGDIMTLNYVWCGAEELIEEAYSTIPEPEDISNNTTGL